ncbi:hypothetical protein ONZ45_g8663 [Pleurotus djamor]|nr:hypothetical protein ONZ45_g8663 [Pleurotus djamor]
MGDISDSQQSHIPITVFTGFLGAGKTSVILSLLPQLPKDYKVVLLKNEFGDVEVDSKLAEQSSLAAVSEILNGCIGSAFPATLAFQIRELEKQTSGDLKLDAIVTVIDAENFQGYEDTSPTARMQASYTDIILINKWEHVNERQLDDVLDHLNTLNDQTPKVRCRGRDGVDPSLIFGLGTSLFTDKTAHARCNTHHDEVETVTIGKTTSGPCSCTDHDHTHSHAVDIALTDAPISSVVLERALDSLSKESIWRVKGFIRLEDGLYILNWAFGRYDLVKSSSGEHLNEKEVIKFTVMGERGEVKRLSRKFAALLGATLE